MLFIHFANWNIFFLLPNNSINCSICVLELTLLKLTQCYSNNCLTIYLSLINLLMVHSGQLGGKGRLCSKHITFHILSQLTKSFDWKSESLFKSKFRYIIIPAVKLQASATNETIYYLSSITDNAWKLSYFQFFTLLLRLSYVTKCKSSHTD